ncbi:MAG: cytochrome c oxidase subunit II [Rhodomicrobium sp.]
MNWLRLLPEQASTQAPGVDGVYMLLIGVSVAIVVLVVALVLTFSLRYRRGTTAKRGPLREFAAREFEIGWTAATFFLFFFIFWFTASAQFTTLVPPRNAMEVHVTGKQWMWKTQHSNGAREINTLHVPVNVPVRVVLTSEDVIHSFFVPAFRIKRDVLPGRYLETWFKATKTGTFHLFCTQFCGTQHSRMIGSVVVLPQEEFAKWLRAQPQADDIAKEGAALFVSLGCAGCHEGASAVHAPHLNGVYGGPVQLSDGRTVVADDAYIRDSILQPGKDIVAGFKNEMPNFAGLIDDSEILRLTAYIRSLKDKGR